MNWLEECSVDLNTASIQDDVDLKIQHIRNIDGVNKNFSVLTEFFVSNTAKVQNSLISIFLDEDKIPEDLLKDVIPHFNNVKMVSQNDVLKEIMLSQPKDYSVNYVKGHSKNPIIQNIYNIDIPINADDKWQQKKVYKIRTEKIEKYENRDFDKILPYLNPPYNMPYVFLSIYDWILNDDLKNSPAIKYFTHKFKEVYLWVDEIQKVTEIQFLK